MLDRLVLSTASVISFCVKALIVIVALAAQATVALAQPGRPQPYISGSPAFENGVLQPDRVRMSLGNFKVGATGAATYDIPIRVAPGTAGIEPKLSFHYNSQLGNGLLGVGWRLSGLSAITRCRRTIAQDGDNGAVTYTTADRFCLGGQKLVAVSGDYGADGTEYRTEKDSFLKVISHGAAGSGPWYFRVRTKEGRILEYGHTEDARIEAVKDGFVQQGMVRVWALNKVSDTSGNYLTVSYHESVGDFRPDEIRYTSNTGLAATRRVQFEYEVRTDVPKRFLGGGEVETRYRLTNVKSYAQVEGEEELIRDYRLQYDTEETLTGRSRLVSIIECATEYYCYEAFVFDWPATGTPAGTFQTKSQQVMVGTVFNGDFNGDGRVDLMRVPEPFFTALLSVCDANCDDQFQTASWGSASVWNGSKAWRGDFNGDGLTDLLTHDGSTFYTYFSDGQTFESPVTDDNSHVKAGFAWTGDFNGDGRSDVVTVDGTVIYTHFSLGNGQYTQASWDRSAVPGAKWSGNNDFFWIGDVDGDRRADLVSFKSQLLRIYRSNGDGSYVYSESPVNDALENPEWHEKYAWTGDYNGDGLMDLVSKKDMADDFSTYFSRGDGTFAATVHSVPQGAGWAKKNVWVGDFSGDGLTDLMSYKNGTFHKYFSQGDGNFEYFGPEPAGSFNKNSAWTGDINGDGLLDVVSESFGVTTTYLTNELYPDLIASIETPIGGVFSVDYAPLSNQSVYVRGDDAAYPTVDVSLPLYVVSGHTASTGCPDDCKPIHDFANKTYSYAYAYQGLKFDLEGRGNLGFEMVRMEDLSGARGIRHTFYEQDFPLEGLVSSIEVSESSGKLMSVTRNDWQVRAYPDHPIVFALLAGVETEECNGDESCRTTARAMEYDAYGNRTRTLYQGIASVVGDEYEEETAWAVVDAGDSWLHRPIERVVRDFDGTELRKSWFYYDDNNDALGQLGARGLLTAEEHDLGGGRGAAGNPKTVTVYDAYGNRASVTDPLGCVTSWAYDATKTFPTSETTCLASNGESTRQFSWEERFGVKTSETDANGNKTVFGYGFGSVSNFGRLSTIAGPLDGSDPMRQYTYFQKSYVGPYATVNSVITRQVIDHQSSFHAATPNKSENFDGLGRVWYEEVRAPRQPKQGRFTAFKEYDSRNLVTRVWEPEWSLPEPWIPDPSPHFTTFSYDALGRTTQVVYPDGTSETTDYLISGNEAIVEITDRRGHTKRRILDAYGRVVRLEEDNEENGLPVTYVTEYTYNALGELLTTKNALGNISVIAYDKLGRKTLHDDPDTGEWSFTAYDKAGNLLEQTDANGNTITFQYDMAGRLTQKTYDEGAGTITWSYDDPEMSNSKGRLTRVVDLAGSESYQYDGMGRVWEKKRIVDGNTYTVTQVWNALNKLSWKMFPDGDSFVYEYGAAGWLTAINKYQLLNGIGYNSRGQILGIAYANWLISWRQYYEDTSRLKSISVNGYQNLEYQYDANGNVTRITDNQGGTASREFVYDHLDRLVQASGTFGGTNQATVSEVYSYDGAGNFTEKGGVAYEYNGLNNRVQATRVGGVVQKTFAYDANGNMTQNGSDQYEWDQDNRLISVNGAVSFSYDYTGRRVKKGAALYPFPDYEIAENGDRKKYFRVNGELVAAKTNYSPPVFYHTDHLGGTHIITNIYRTIQQILEYDPWGRISRNFGQFDNVKKFTGQEYDEETDLYYYVGRYYDPVLARFTRPDPFVSQPFNPQNLNRYSYVMNSPASSTDPSGFSSDSGGDNFFQTVGNALWRPISKAGSAVFSWLPDILGGGGGPNSNSGPGDTALVSSVGPMEILFEVEMAQLEASKQLVHAATSTLLEAYAQDARFKLAVAEAAADPEATLRSIAQEHHRELLLLYEVAKERNARLSLVVGFGKGFGGLIGFSVDPDGFVRGEFAAGVGYAVFGGGTLSGRADIFNGGKLHQFRFMEIQMGAAYGTGAILTPSASHTGATLSGGGVFPGYGVMFLAGAAYSTDPIFHISELLPR